MKQQKIITYFRGNGKRTSCTLTDYQLKTLDALADFLGLTRNQYLRMATDGMPEGVNASAYIRDEMFLRLRKMLSMTGVEL